MTGSVLDCLLENLLTSAIYSSENVQPSLYGDAAITGRILGLV